MLKQMPQERRMSGHFTLATSGTTMRNLARNLPLQVLAMASLFTAAAVYEAFHLSALAGVSVWSHLRTGIWILQNHAVPHNGIFSQYPDLPWMARSWGFDVLLAAAYQSMGLRALPLLLMAFRVILALTLFWSARGSRQNLWPTALLAAVAQYAIPDLQLQPALCSILLLAVELALLFHARRNGNPGQLLWLPLLFAFWANLDIHFVYGLPVLVMFLAAIVMEEICRRIGVGWLESNGPAMPLGMVGAVTAASLIATLLTPYTYHVYGVLPTVFGVSALYPYLPELHALGFRRPQDFVLLTLTMTAFFSLGRRHSRNIFKLALMIASAMLSFRSQRDCWVVAVVSVAVIADALALDHAEPVQRTTVPLWRSENLATAALVLLILLVAVTGRIPSSRQTLLSDVGKTLPVAACDYIRQNHLPGPLFNGYEWGGFLTWYLPEYPVVIDARNDLYGEEVSVRYFRLTHAEIPLSADFHFVYADTILLQRNSPMAVALSAVPRFTVAYKDDVAMVLLPGR